MSDGYIQCRKYGKRLRCLAHIIRKARGLAESCHTGVAVFGEKVLKNLTLFIEGIYEARGDPIMNLPEKFAQNLANLKELSIQYRDNEQKKRKDWRVNYSMIGMEFGECWNIQSYRLPITSPNKRYGTGLSLEK